VSSVERFAPSFTMVPLTWFRTTSDSIMVIESSVSSFHKQTYILLQLDRGRFTESLELIPKLWRHLLVQASLNGDGMTVAKSHGRLAWAATEAVGDSAPKQNFELVDPTHIIVRDLYIGITAATATGTDEFNYYIELEEISLTDNEAVMAIIQEESQDVN